MKIIVPIHFVPVRKLTLSQPLFFLAGPVRGGGDWQHKMCGPLEVATQSKCTAVIPCRWDNNHSLSKIFTKSDTKRFSRQLHWERHYLYYAGLDLPKGCIIFWFGSEDSKNPHPGPEPYSMDTRREFGTWLMLKKLRDARVVFGGDRNFHGLSVILDEIQTELGRHVPFYYDLRSLADAAVEESSRKID